MRRLKLIFIGQNFDRVGAVHARCEALGHSLRIASDLAVAASLVAEAVPDAVLIGAEALDSETQIRLPGFLRHTKGHLPLLVIGKPPDDFFSLAQTETTDAIDSDSQLESLGAVLDHLLTKSAAQLRPTEDVDLGSKLEGDDALATGPRNAKELIARWRGEIATELAEGINALWSNQRLHADPEIRLDRLHALVASILSGERLEKLAGAAAFSLGIVKQDSVLGGDLAHVPLAEVFQLLKLQSQTGHFCVQTPESRFELYFRQGAIDYVTARGARKEFLLGRYLVKRGMISRDDLDWLLENRRGTSKKLGHQLVKLGYITRAELSAAMEDQCRELIYELLRWPKGRFDFVPLKALPEEAAELPLNLNVEELLMEGYRRIDEWRVIGREIRGFDLVPVILRDTLDRLGLHALKPEERAALAQIDSRSSIKTLVEQGGLSSFDFCQVLYRLRKAHVIELRGGGRPAD